MSWAEQAADRRLVVMTEALQLAQKQGFAIIMTMLSEPEEGASDEDRTKWERTCDHCGKHCPEPVDFYTGTLSRDVGLLQVIVTFGSCAECKELL